MKQSLFIVLAGSIGWLTASTAPAQLTSQGVHAEASGYYTNLGAGISTGDVDIVPGSSQAQASALANNNSVASSASIGSLWVMASAETTPTEPGNGSKMSGHASAHVANLTGSPLVIEGLYAVRGDGSATVINTTDEENGSGQFSFTLANNDSWFARVGAVAQADGLKHPSFGPEFPRSSASMMFTARRQDEPTKPLPGSTANNAGEMFACNGCFPTTESEDRDALISTADP
jgi:hypothetical protein